MHALIYRAVAAAMLAAASLGFTSVPAAATAGGPCAPPDSSGLVVCTFDGNAGTAPATYALAIPAGSPDFTVDVFGAQGGKGNSTPPVPTGLGAEARAKFTAPPGGTSLSLTVADAGATGTTPNGGRGYEAGGSGGAPAASGIVPGAGGGGSSAVVDGTKLLADAAGGGGAGSGITSLDVNGGNAGGAGATGVQGSSSSPGAGGSGATSSSAGSGGQGGSCNGQTGASGTGAGGQGGPVTVIIGAIGGGPGGGGGGGFFGGGGGGQGGWCPPSAQSPFNISGGGGGGGGSSYVSSSATSSTILDGANAPQAGNGKVVVSYPMPITLTSFTPGSGRVGSRVTLTGSGFTWASSIKFGGTVAKFTIVSDTEIMTTAPYRALSSRITVANSAGAAATSASRFAVKPGISGFSPRSGRPGTSVTITGTAFTGATKVTFHGVRASFKVTSYGRITAIVPRHATTGPIRVSTPAGAAKTRRTFRVT